ncbi:hypothetical protein EOD42_14030 [Rhodovarius crocodyli]|uniref:Uncharacterized protein n=1 Tax=Rhodovarius crocodyli TaxID=1979269 RepID=A0A437MF01_9PROT|nr:hypothetical protein [Rhodovarius crocodyli]RVT96228.1 hypothetical protein EOD42_14030 [Rhodovarius crocodyli]
MSQLSEAQIEQRREAAKARWSRYGRQAQHAAIAGAIGAGVAGLAFRRPRPALLGAALTAAIPAGRFLAREISGDPDLEGATLSDKQTASVLRDFGARTMRERLIVRDRSGRVTMDNLGGKESVAAITLLDVVRGESRRPDSSAWHNHPHPALPSATDLLFGQRGVVVQPDGSTARFKWVGGDVYRDGLGELSDVASEVLKLSGEAQGALREKAVKDWSPAEVGQYAQRWSKHLEGLKRRKLIELEIRPSALSKRQAGQPLSDAERNQRVEAARARWANASTRGDGEAAPKKPWSGERLGLARGMKVQASTTLAPTWRHNYDGSEWGHDAPPAQDGGRMYQALSRRPQVPDGMKTEDFVALGRWASATSRDMRDRIVAEGVDGDRARKKLSTIPASRRNDAEAIKMAFNHARMLALHDIGLIRVKDFKLTPEAKEKLQGLEPFMWRARRQISNPLREQHAETWASIRRQYGEAFADGRTHRVATRGAAAGETKRRFERHSTLVKEAPADWWAGSGLIVPVGWEA